MGTAGYLAPEQARGEDPTARSDIWAVGVLLHELLTGRLPFRGDYEAARLYSVVHEPHERLPADLGEVGIRCQAVIDRCLAKDPAARYASAEELAAALADVLVEPADRDPAATGGGHRRSRRRLAGGAAVVLAAVVATAAWGGRGLAVRLGVARAVVDRRGVAVLPVTFAEDTPDGAALGAGLGWFLADRLSRFEGLTDDFWIVPAAAIPGRRTANEGDARRSFGVRRILRGTGRLDGSTLTVDLTYDDGAGGRHASRRFSDDLANLGTWQRDLPAWAAGVLDADLAGDAEAVLSRGRTTVPAAFWSWVQGAGIVWQQDADRDTAVLAAGVRRLAAAVREDSSFVCARADWSWARFRLEPAAARDARAGALAALERAARMSPTAVWPMIYLAHRAEHAGDEDRALALYDSVLSRDPANHEALAGRAAALAEAGRTDEAAAAYARALARRPDYAPLLLDLGRFHYRAGDFAAARDAFARAVTVTPGSDYAWYFLGAARFALDDLDGAAEAFARALAIRPSYGVLSNLGTLAYYRERYADAAGFYRRALAHRSNATAWKHLAEAWRWLPDHADSSRQAYRRAADLAAAEVAATDGPTWDLQAELATFHTALGDTAAADRLMRGIADAAPDLGYEAMFHLAVACEDLGRREDALAWLARAFAAGLPPERPERYPGFRNLRADARYRALVKRRGSAS